MIKTRRAYLRVLQGLVAVAHVVVAAALFEVVPVLAAISLAGLVLALCAWRMQVIAADPPRSAVVVRWVDLPVCCHVAAGLFGLILWPLLLLAQVLLCTSGAFSSWSARAVTLESAVASYAAALPLALWATTAGRLWVRLRTIVVAVPGWPSAFDGYRIAHLSDLHVGSFDPPERARRWLERAQTTEPDLLVVTGDLVATGIRHYAAVARLVGELRAPDGVLVVTGNHDQWDRAEFVRRFEAEGARVLDGRSVEIVRGRDSVVVAGIDGARLTRARGLAASHPVGGREDPWPDFWRAALAEFERPPRILLAHDPAVFDVAAAVGVSLTLSGHTHAGQVALPLFGRWVNMARLMAKYTRGLYRNGDSSMYVNSGLGVTGLPIRFGARPEIAVIEVRRQGSGLVSRRLEGQSSRGASEEPGNVRAAGSLRSSQDLH